MRPLLFKTGIIICLALALLAGYSRTGSTAEEAARIIYLKGRVKIQHPGDDFWVLAKRGMVVKDKDKIKTFAGSEAEIALDSTLKNILKIGPDTTITLEELKEKRLYMPKGKVFSVIEALPAGSSFEIKTPTAVAGIRGSGISVDTDGRTTNVKCFEDRAYVKGINIDGTPMTEIIIIDKGYKRLIRRLEMPGELIALTAVERDEWSRFREKLKEHLNWLREKRAEGSRGAALEMHRIGRMHERYEAAEEGVEDILNLQSPYPDID